jgi:hypothetical protein
MLQPSNNQRSVEVRERALLESVATIVGGVVRRSLPCPAPFNIRWNDNGTCSGDGAGCSNELSHPGIIYPPISSIRVQLFLKLCVRLGEASANKPLMKCRKRLDDVRTGGGTSLLTTAACTGFADLEGTSLHLSYSSAPPYSHGPVVTHGTIRRSAAVQQSRGIET